MDGNLNPSVFPCPLTPITLSARQAFNVDLPVSLSSVTGACLPINHNRVSIVWQAGVR